MPDKPDTTNIRIATTPYRDSDPPLITKSSKTIIEQLATDLTGAPYTEEAAKTKTSVYFLMEDILLKHLSTTDAVTTMSSKSRDKKLSLFYGCVNFLLFLLAGGWLISTYKLPPDSHLLVTFASLLVTLAALSSVLIALQTDERSDTKRRAFIFKCLRERPRLTACAALVEYFAQLINTRETELAALFEGITERMLTVTIGQKVAQKYAPLPSLLQKAREDMEGVLAQCAGQSKLFETLVLNYEQECDPAWKRELAEQLDAQARDLQARLAEFTRHLRLIDSCPHEVDNLTAEVAFIVHTCDSLKEANQRRLVIVEPSAEEQTNDEDATDQTAEKKRQASHS